MLAFVHGGVFTQCETGPMKAWKHPAAVYGKLNCAAAFTLAELLVVIAVIAFLAGEP